MCHCPGELHPHARGCSPLYNEQLSSLTLLQQTANHLGLIIPDTKEVDPLKRKEAKKLALTAFKGHEALLKGKDVFLKMSNEEICCKMKVLKQMIRTFHHSDKSVILCLLQTK